MLRHRVQRPSVIVGAWAALVLAVFVVRGDLRIGAAAEPASERGPAIGREPLIVRGPASARAIVPTVVKKGRVYDALGFLIVGAEIVPMHQAATRTDGDGSFVIELTPGAVTDLLVRAAGRQPVWLRVSEGSPDALALQMVPAAPWDLPPAPPLSPSSLRGEGIARAPDVQPLASAFVTAEGTGIWARTDDIGRFVLPLPVPTATLVVHAPHGGAGDLGFVGIAEPIVPGRTHGAVPLPDLVAGPAAGIRGVVRDPRGVPIAGVPVAIVGTRMRRLVDTGPGGAFRVGGLVPGDYRVQPFAWRGAVGVAHDVTLTNAAVDIDVQLLAADEVRLRVVDERGDTVSGVIVASAVGGTRRGVASVDDDGFAAVPVAARTEFDVRTRDDFEPVTVRRFDAEPATLVVAMP